MKPIAIAIIGYGKIAEDQHVPAIQGNDRFELVATSSRSGQGVARTFTDWRALIREVEGLQAVAITTPPGPRYEIARECLLAGLHCLLEKPPTAGLAEIADLACLAEAQQRSLFTTWHAQHHSTVEAAAKALAGKRIASMDIHWHEDVHKWHPGQRWIWEPGGFGVFDPGINALSIATRILPEPLFVREATLLVPANKQAPIAASLAFTEPGFAAEMDWRHAEGEAWTIRIATGDGTMVELREGGARLLVGGLERAIEQRGEYPALYDHFAGLIAARRSDVDRGPLRIVADAFLVARRETVEAFL